MVLRIKKLKYLGVHWKIQLLGGEGSSRKANVEWRIALKGVGEAWAVCRFKGGLARGGGAIQGGGVDTPIHTMHGTWKSKSIKLNTWKYNLIEQLNKNVFKANNPTSQLESGQQKNEYCFSQKLPCPSQINP